VAAPIDARAVVPESLPDWTPVPDGPASGRRPMVGIALRGATGVAVAAVLWLSGAHVPAVVLLAVLIFATAASVRVPAVAKALALATKTIQGVAARTLTLIVLAVLELLIVTPVSLLLALIRVDPLKAGTTAAEGSFWLVTQSHPTRSLYRREFAYERSAATGRRDQSGRRRWARTAVTAIATLVIADLAIGALIHTQDPPAIVNPARTLSLLPNVTEPAQRSEPWVKELGLELGHVYYGQRFDPYLGWVMPEFNGRYVHVAAGLRRSYEAPASQSPRAVRVFFFGGSALFGVFQRDAETIPSDISRLAAAAGIPVKVYNFGAIGYVNWQELLRFQQLISSGQAPDLAVFYDGANELLTQFRLGPHTSPSHPEAQALAKLLPFAGVTQPADETSTASPLSALSRAYANVSAVSWLLRRLRGVATTPSLTLPPFAGSQSQNAASAGRDAALIYNRGVQVAGRLAAGYHIKSAFFWQPIFYSKRRIPGELPPEALLGTDPAAWTGAYRIARADLRPPAVDVAGALNAVTTPVMFDFIHTNELGAEAVSQELFAHLVPTLRALYRSKHG